MGRRRRSRWPLGSGQLARAGGHAKDFLKIFARAVVGCLGWVGGCGGGDGGGGGGGGGGGCGGGGGGGGGRGGGVR